MSETPAEEKKRLLRERRQAKMAKGNATNRLNSILGQSATGNSTSVVSVLDKQENSTKSPVQEDSPTPLHDDPEVPDITSLVDKNERTQSMDNKEMEELFKNIMAGKGPTAGGDPSMNGDSQNDLFSQMMKMMSENNGQGNGEAFPPGQSMEELDYNTKLATFHKYEQQRISILLFVARLILHVANYFYHVHSYASFRSSIYSYIRGPDAQPVVKLFLVTFFTLELVFISSYFLIMSHKGLLKVSSRNHFASKMVSMASMVLPQANSLQPLVDTLLVYWGGMQMLMSDVSLIVVLFGLTSIYS